MLEPSARSAVGTSGEDAVRLELTTAEVRQVWALYASPPSATPSDPRAGGGSAPSLFEGLLPLAWRSRRRLAQSAAVALALGALFLTVATPTFPVKALVLVEPHAAAWDARAEGAGSPAFLDGQAAILAGAPLVHDALVRSGLAAASGPAESRAGSVGALAGVARAPEEALGDAVKRTLRAYSATPVRGTQVIALEVRTQDPAGGERFLRAAIERYAELVRSPGPGEIGVTVRTLAEPAQQATPLWPRPLPVLVASLGIGLLVGLALAVRSQRTEPPEPEWTELREAAWAA